MDEATRISDRKRAAYSDVFEWADWLFYSGKILNNSRPFFRERANQHFHKEEIKTWGRDSSTEGMEWPIDSSWDGKANGTNEQTIFEFSGGTVCGHSFMPLSVFVVTHKYCQGISLVEIINLHLMNNSSLVWIFSNSKSLGAIKLFDFSSIHHIK
jgi:hypothetical protein